MRKPPATALPRTSSGSAIAIVWGSWLVIVLILALLNSPFSHYHNLAGELAVLLHMAATLMIVIHFYRRPVAILLALSLIFRTGLVFWDVGFSDVFLLPNSGADTEVFYYWSVQVARDPSLVFAEFRGGEFSKLFGLLFWLTGPSRTFGQYTNALLGLTTVLILEATLKRLPLDGKQSVRVLALAALLPNTLILSAIFLRESIVSLLVAISVYFFVRWYRDGGPINIVLVAATIIAASTLHAGVIAVGVGYMLVVLFYRRSTGRFGFEVRSVAYLALFALIVYFIVARHPDLFLGKFEQLESEQDVFTATNHRAGDSQYLADLTVTNYVDLLRTGPLRAFYFLGSPLPWDFRGLNDVFTFVGDSLFYIGTLVAFWAVRSQLRHKERVLGYATILVIVLATLVFGAGVSNAGSAMRHRFKLLSLFLLLAGIVATRARRSMNEIEGASQRAESSGPSDASATTPPATRS